MTASEFLQGANPIIASILGAHIIAASVVWRKGVDLGNLRDAQARAVYGIASGLENMELVAVIRAITEEDPRLLMPAKPNQLFRITVCLTVFLGAVAVFYEPLTKFPSLTTYATAELAFAVAVFLFSVWVMAGEYRYLANIEKWAKNFQDNGQKKIHISCSVSAEGRGHSAGTKNVI